MKVTDIRIRIGKQTENIERLKAYADITFDESFVIHGLKNNWRTKRTFCGNAIKKNAKRRV